MFTSLFTEPFHSAVQNISMPDFNEDQILIKMLRVGVCGSDMQVFSGKNRFAKFPIIPFHEGVGTVSEVGK